MTFLPAEQVGRSNGVPTIKSPARCRRWRDFNSGGHYYYWCRHISEMKGTGSSFRLGFSTADQVRRSVIPTGIVALDKLLGGGLETGLMYLFYGDRCLNDDLLRIAVQMQLPAERKGVNSPTIIIDSANMIKIDKLTDYSFEFELEPEEVMERIYISRAFNSSQTYALVMEQLPSFFERVSARLLIIAGLPDLYISERMMTGEGLQQLTHMATKLMTLTLNREIVTLVSAPSSQKNRDLPAGGTALSSYAQVHIHVSESKSYIKYTLAKHPQYPIRRTSRVKPSDFGTTLPLSHFLDGSDGE